MSELKNLTPEDQKRLFDELIQDPKFRNTRNAMLALVTIGGIALFGSGWLMINKILTLLDVVTVIAFFVFANVCLVQRLKKMQNAVLDRWKKESLFKGPGTF